MSNVKEKHKSTFKKTVETINENNLFKEPDYYTAEILLKKIISRDTNYILIGDLSSSYNIKIMRKMAKLIKKFDDNITNLSSEKLDETVEHMKTIDILLNRIGEIIKEKNED